ncbi:MAG: T9SS type A sorting domain-containing protein [Bacteroidetes bacterium]|nr:T9SS type A sorting domain-containing protein [Bacteroidota bacterium]
MNKLYSLFLFYILSYALSAQTYMVGTLTTTYTDVNRNNRAISVEMHYPAIAPGSGTTMANGSFPFVVFGHGFQMTASSYYPFADSLVRRGYIIAFANTENSFSPSHSDFAKDLLFIYSTIISENNNSGSPLFGHVVSRGAIGGHSMGGGATVLSAQYGDSATCYFTFAEATTNPSSITAAQYLTKPYLSFAGSYDCIAPYSTNQLPTYNATTSACKWLIDITGASHCNFGLSNTQCGIGETFSGCSNPPLSQSAQINTVLSYLYPYLDFHLKGNVQSHSSFDSIYTSDNSNTKQTNCIYTTGITGEGIPSLKAYPNPVSSVLHVTLAVGERALVADMCGKVVRDWAGDTEIDLSPLAPGVYILQIINARSECRSEKIIKK